jgi:hypothetical protein
MVFESLGLLLQACGFETLNTGNWIGINTLVVLLSITIAALVYALANLLNAERREKMKGYVRYEILEAAFSLIILVSLILIASFACTAGGALFGYKGYSGLFAASDTYLGNILFVSGLSAMGNVFSLGVQYTQVSNIALIIANTAESALSPKPALVKISPSTTITDLFLNFSALFTGLADTLALSFGGLFVLFLLLPIISATALTVVAPTALLLRSLSFMGPQLRRTSNLFLAIAIGFYFVLPLMIGTNAYIASCLSIYASASQPSCNYPFFSPYIVPYTLFSVSTSSLFGSGVQAPLSSSNLPGFGSGGILGAFSIPFSIYGTSAGTTITGIWNLVFNAPGVATKAASQVAAYFFMGIVLVALDLGVTAAFVMGINRGLNALGRFSGGSFFGG